jgi:hypothetical protein
MSGAPNHPNKVQAPQQPDKIPVGVPVSPMAASGDAVAKAGQ